MSKQVKLYKLPWTHELSRYTGNFRGFWIGERFVYKKLNKSENYQFIRLHHKTGLLIFIDELDDLINEMSDNHLNYYKIYK